MSGLQKIFWDGVVKGLGFRAGFLQGGIVGIIARRSLNNCQHTSVTIRICHGRIIPSKPYPHLRCPGIQSV